MEGSMSEREMIETEIKIIRDFSDYAVSQEGDVFRIVSRVKNDHSPIEPYKLKTGMADGYIRICLSKNGKSYYRSVHRLVLDAFVGICPDGCEAVERCVEIIESQDINDFLGNGTWDISRDETLNAIRSEFKGETK
jgi:hypothetical protein